MRHVARIKKKPKLNSFTNIKQLLHSIIKSKSTYFYKQRGFLYSIPLASTLALLLVTGFTINPMVYSEEDKVYAEEATGQTDTTEMSVSLMMNNQDDSTLTNNSQTGIVNYVSTGFTIKAENVDGYNVYLQTTPGSTNKLTNGTLSIDFVTTGTPTSEFSDNTWGYAIDDTGTTVENLNYNPIPDTVASSLNPAYTSDKTNDERNFTLSFATKFANNAAPGHYTSGVTLSVAAGAREVTNTGFAGKKYMYEVDKTFCENPAITVGTQGRLIDDRDGKVYWVAKLKDKNCWMTQNLAHDGGGSKGSFDWWPKNTSNATYYNPGVYVYTKTPEDDVCFTSVGMTECLNHGWKKLEDQVMTAYPDDSWTSRRDDSFYSATSYLGTDNETHCTKKANSYFGDMKSENIACRVYDDSYVELLHYSIGNYYSWVAATNGISQSNGDVLDSSVCPTGWRLPTGRSSGEFSTLLSGSLTGTSTEVYGNIKLTPYYYASSGYIEPTDENKIRLNNLGEVGRYWSGTAIGNYTQAQSISYGSAGLVDANRTAERYYGYSVRCIAK